MGLQLVAVCRSIEVEQVNPQNGAPFEARTAVVQSMDLGRTYVRIARDFIGPEPTPGEEVTLAVSVRPYQTKAGALGYGLTAMERVN